MNHPIDTRGSAPSAKSSHRLALLAAFVLPALAAPVVLVLVDSIVATLGGRPETPRVLVGSLLIYFLYGAPTALVLMAVVAFPLYLLTRRLGILGGVSSSAWRPW